MESNQEDLNRKLDEQSNKSVAYYQALISAFMESRMELDRQMITISVAALGFLLTFSEKLIFNSGMITLLLITLFLFTGTTLYLLFIFSKNSALSIAVINEKDEEAKKLEVELGVHDKNIRVIFGAGIICTVILFIFFIFNLESQMSNKTNTTTRSLSGILAAKPVLTETKPVISETPPPAPKEKK